MTFQPKRKTPEDFIAGADGEGHLPAAPAPVSPPVLVADSPLISEAEARSTEPPAVATPVASLEAPQYAAKPQKVHDKDLQFPLKMTRDFANKVESAYFLRDPNVFGSRQEMLQKMLSVALDAYIKSRS